MSAASVLLVEDEKSIIELVRYNLEQAGYRVQTAEDGQKGLDLAKKNLPDLILLDLMLPKLDGLEVCKELKGHKTTQSIPIIFLTARGEEIDKILGLELGADDYITKPFSPRELLARIKAVLRRGTAAGPAVMKVGALEFDQEKHVVTLKGKPVELTSKEFGLLEALLESEGRVLSREVLLEKVWGLDRAMNIETRTVDMHVGQLRKKIKSEAHRILTVKNVGYRFDNEA